MKNNFTYLLFLLLLLVWSCTPKTKSSTDTLPTVQTGDNEKKEESHNSIEEHQRIPDGVELAKHRTIVPDGKGFTKKRVEPPFWWVGMEDPIVEVVIYDYNIYRYRVSVDHPEVKVKEVTKVENPNYLFVQLEIPKTCKAGKFNIELTKGDDVRSYPYELKTRKPVAGRIEALDPSDFIYLILPDRFANGDPSNDDISEMNQTGVDRENVFYRHGGDIQGIIDQLDYIQSLGVTALWVNPVQENNQPYDSYHGYAITDHYKIDPRFGTNELYVKLSNECQKRGIKLVMDIIHNHVGDQHWMILDLPSKDWIHQFDTYRKTTYRAPTLMDPYAAKADSEIMTDGWFDNHMPDLNQQHPQLARYLTQNNIWWIEYAGLDAFRIDTYAYNDQEFMSNWGKAIKDAYSSFTFFGETWVHGTTIQAQFTQNNNLREGYNSNLPGVTDYQVYYAILEALAQEQGWTSGNARIYYTLAKDFLYEDPFRNVLFLDNHDLGRIYGVLKKDMKKFKSGLAMLMTLRGIPMMYYGTEIAMTGEGGAFGEGGRVDFPGGWPGDTKNKFNAADRNAEEQDAFNYIQKLATYRKNTSALHRGKLMQFVPENDIYVYFRYDDKTTVMVIVNTSGETQQVNTSRFAERMKGFNSAKEVVTGKQFSSLNSISIGGYESLVLELK